MAEAHNLDVPEQLLERNKNWANDIGEAFFRESVQGPQVPKVLWIGCIDSRVPESVITASMPGQILTHRNIANQFHLDDNNALSVLSLAIQPIGVSHIIVVGHTYCGGVNACHAAAHGGESIDPNTPLGRWLAPLTALAEESGLSIPDLVKENVCMQVRNVEKSEAVRAARAEGKNLWIHGWLYQLEAGCLHELIKYGPKNML
ncbi:carbonic anhydrase [Sparassis latifolia]|uniref:Carbonic anhydrase n=1 Tax=Sparassis crispa TaxID=139825 RepID=A0A401H077_9APHY|nr:Carbonic anhydrase [Sparassis crispa]GBE87800.1 Carbonic anhydrase [Sparassis crispa]